MTVNQPISELPVDRREETVVTQQPGYAATEQVTHDVAAERRMQMYQLTRIIWTILGLLEIFLGIRFVLHLIGANAASGFAQFVYGVTGPFMAPFVGLVSTPRTGATVFEVTALIAMAVYALLFWIVMRIMPIAVDRPSARTVSRSVREQTPGSAGGVGTDRTTHPLKS